MVITLKYIQDLMFDPLIKRHGFQPLRNAISTLKIQDSYLSFIMNIFMFIRPH